MRCLHPFCPKGSGATDWNAVVVHPELGASLGARALLLSALNSRFARPPSHPAKAAAVPTSNQALLKRLVELCPCLYNQMNVPVTARGVVHFCELTLAAPITHTNVHQAFLIQHPRAPLFKLQALRDCTDGGTVMEMLCSEVLESAGIPAMQLDDSGWPVWQVPGHILLNEGKMSGLRAFGDLLIPCGPTNLVISVKSEAARERLLYSSNSIEGIGFGFFSEPKEFWTMDRMRLYKRMGFSAIYMPDSTHAKVMTEIAAKSRKPHAVNINGTELYRPFATFAADMQRVVGRSSFLL